MRVAQEEANARLERAYLEARTAPQSRVRITVEGRFEQRPRIDRPGREDVLVVERVVGIDPEGRCEREDAPLTGTTWRLVQLGDRLLSPGAREATLRLTESDSTVAGTGGCNRFGGRYRLDGASQVRFSRLASTKRLCEERTMRVEERFLDALQRAERYRVAHRSLELFRGDARLARFRAIGGDGASE
jgi:heat shock protein HslJ